LHGICALALQTHCILLSIRPQVAVRASEHVAQFDELLIVYFA